MQSIVCKLPQIVLTDLILTSRKVKSLFCRVSAFVETAIVIKNLNSYLTGIDVGNYNG